MGVKIIPEIDIFLTEGAAARYRREWKAACAYTVSPPTFENFVRRQIIAAEERDKADAEQHIEEIRKSIQRGARRTGHRFRL
jgi:hypothetical protein